MNYAVLNHYEAHIATMENRYHFSQAQLFELALRMNKKRCFLFVSKVLGKHLAVHPAIPLLTSHLLAYLFLERRLGITDAFAERIREALQDERLLPTVLQASSEKSLSSPQALTIIGFAETATALGHGFFEKWCGDVQFVHTTREQLAYKKPLICFEEEHSHATSHRIYAEESVFLREAEVVLVDDEMTTGQTNANIIRQLHKAYPHLKCFTLVAILDFRSQEAARKLNELAQELNITIQTVALFRGTCQIEQLVPLPEEAAAQNTVQKMPCELVSFEQQVQHALMEQISVSEAGQYSASYYQNSGRFGLTCEQQQQLYPDIKAVAQTLQRMRGLGRCLVLGTGEFMYMPMRIAAEMGPDVVYHTTTRSPIYAHPQSAIHNKFTFPSVEFPGVTNFLYSIPQQTYTDLFVIYERVVDRAAAEQLYALLKPYAQHVHFVTIGGEAHAICTG